MENEFTKIPGIRRSDLEALVRYLLNPSYGATRTAKGRRLLLTQHHLRPRLHDNDAVFQTLYDMEKVSAPTAYKLLELCDEVRPQVAASRFYANTRDRREKLAAYMRQFRWRRSTAVAIEEYRLGRALTASEKKTLIEEAQKRWNIRRDAYVANRGPDKGKREADMEFSAKLDAELEEKLAKAKASGAVKVTSSSVRVRSNPAKPTSDQLNALTEKFGH